MRRGEPRILLDDADDEAAASHEIAGPSHDIANAPHSVADASHGTPTILRDMRMFTTPSILCTPPILHDMGLFTPPAISRTPTILRSTPHDMPAISRTPTILCSAPHDTPAISHTPTILCSAPHDTPAAAPHGFASVSYPLPQSEIDNITCRIREIERELCLVEQACVRRVLNDPTNHEIIDAYERTRRRFHDYHTQ